MPLDTSGVFLMSHNTIPKTQLNPTYLSLFFEIIFPTLQKTKMANQGAQRESQ